MFFKLTQTQRKCMIAARDVRLVHVNQQTRIKLPSGTLSPVIHQDAIKSLRHKKLIRRTLLDDETGVWLLTAAGWDAIAEHDRAGVAA